MKNFRIELSWLVTILLGFLTTDRAQASSKNVVGDLGSTSWQLVKFLGSDDKTLVPDDRSRYTITFESDGSVSVRIDCNRGHGTWKSSGLNQIEFGPMALTRAMCPPAPLNDRIPKDWPYVRSYMRKEGHLFLALMADGGIYEFEPMAAEGTKRAAVKGTAAYRERMALPADAVLEVALEDASKADAPAEVIARVRKEHPGSPPIAFEITYDPAKIDPRHAYSVWARITVGDQLMFTTMQNYPVLTQGNSNEVTVLLQRPTEPIAGSSPEAGLSGLPATFGGTLPCADCPGIRYQVNLLADHTFVSRMTYEERDSGFDERGSWQLANDGRTLVMQRGNETREQFALLDGNTLRKLDANGNEIESKLNYDLKRTPQFTPIEQSSLGAGNASLENTYWKLASLGDTAVASASQQQEPHLVFNSENHHVSGSGGCNRLTGSYEINGDQLSLGEMASTMMACLKGMDTEQAFLKALSQVKTWKITGQHLELFDIDGKLVARLEAHHMK